MRKMKLSPSMMCANLFSLDSVIRTFEKKKIDYLHIDIMDGEFVPNLMLGSDYCEQIKKNTEIPLDIHLMIYRPEEKIAWFPVSEGDIVSFHLEATGEPLKAIYEIKKRKAKAYIAIKPHTDFNLLLPYLEDIDGVLLMTVEPGHAGQKLLPTALDRIHELRAFLVRNGYGHLDLEVDGHVSFQDAYEMAKRGANVFVCGSSSIFSKENEISENIDRFRKLITF